MMLHATESRHTFAPMRPPLLLPRDLVGVAAISALLIGCGSSAIETIPETERLRSSALVGNVDVLRDDFGVPEAAFTVCTFWLAEALAMVGRRDDARRVFEAVLQMHNGLGLFAEDLLIANGAQSGNFPQTYSHVGLINAAFRLSRPWD